MIKTASKSLLALSFIVSLVFGSFISQVNAYRGPILNTFRFDIEADPGDVITRSFTVKHDYQPNNDGTTKIVDLYPRVLNFTQGDNPGIPQFLSEGTLPSTASLADWVTLSSNRWTLDEQNEEIEISFTISVPQDADPGGKYAAILLSNKLGEEAIANNDLDDTGLGVNSELGPLLFLTVRGDVSKNIDLVDIYTRNIKGKTTDFFTNPPVEVVAEFENTGNVHVVPRGVVIIHRGDDISNPIATFQLNPNGTAILPGTVREYPVVWNDSFISSSVKENSGENGEQIKYQTNYNWDKLSKIRIGQYTATVQYDYELADGTVAPTVLVSARFTVIPWQLIILIAIPVILMLLLIYYKYRKYKK